ncbi:MAG TPA: hypothetical protein VHD90_21420, partial [Phototrophicaceae bacterium]|nr:hypothetical protein [Phototrophicaceae bacterium]
MLRFLIFTSLRLLIAFTGISLLICKQWGWSEYASPELYVVYSQGENGDYLINMSGNDEPERLAPKIDSIFALACSPDGRRLAVLTTTLHHYDPHLYVISPSGIEYEKFFGENQLFDMLNSYSFFDMSIANDGTVALPLPAPTSPTLTNLTGTI